jgi:hypothetical protein
MEGGFDRLILVPGTGFEPARVCGHPIASKAIASTDSDHPGTVKLEAGAGNDANDNSLSVPAISGGGLGNKENSPRHELFVVMNIEASPSVFGLWGPGADYIPVPNYSFSKLE